MNLQTAIDGILVMVLLLNLAMLSAGRVATCIRIFALECLVISVLPVAAELVPLGEGTFSPHAFLMMAFTIGLKVVLIPWILLRVIRTGDLEREVDPYIGFTGSVVLGALMVGGCFALGSRLAIPGHPMSSLLIPVALSTLLIGLLILISRRKAITQVLGYLVLENGIYLFGLSLMQSMPMLVEMGILLDIFVGVFIMAIVTYHIRREFDSIDTHDLTQAHEAGAEALDGGAGVAAGSAPRVLISLETGNSKLETRS